MKWKEFDKVYEKYHKLVLHVAYDILQDHDLAQDVCQEVFVAYYKKMGTIGKSRVKGWLLGCAHEKAAGHREGTHRRDEAATTEEDRGQEQISGWKMEN